MLIFCLLAGWVYGQQEAWDLALAHFRSGNYTEAEAIWSAMAEEQASAAVWYNLGNVKYQQRDIPASILYFRRALKIDPGHQHARDNLEVALAAIQDPVPAIRPFFLARWWKEVVGLFTANTWAVCFLFCFSALIAVVLLKYLGRWSPGKLYWYLLSAIVLLTVLSGGAANSAYISRYANDKAVSLKWENTLYTSPDSDSPVLRTFPGGTAVRIADSLEGFYKVILPNLEQGWVPVGSCERI